MLLAARLTQGCYHCPPGIAAFSDGVWFSATCYYWHWSRPIEFLPVVGISLYPNVAINCGAHQASLPLMEGLDKVNRHCCQWCTHQALLPSLWSSVNPPNIYVGDMPTIYCCPWWSGISVGGDAYQVLLPFMVGPNGHTTLLSVTVPPGIATWRTHGTIDISPSRGRHCCQLGQCIPFKYPPI